MPTAYPLTVSAASPVAAASLANPSIALTAAAPPDHYWFTMQWSGKAYAFEMEGDDRCAFIAAKYAVEP